MRKTTCDLCANNIDGEKMYGGEIAGSLYLPIDKGRSKRWVIDVCKDCFELIEVQPIKEHLVKNILKDSTNGKQENSGQGVEDRKGK